MTVTVIWWMQIADSPGDAASNPDAPAPLEDDEAETTEDNDEETDGITNEEAGLE